VSIGGRPPLEELPPLPPAVVTTGAGVLRGGLWKLIESTLPQVYTLIVSIVAARVLGPDGMGRQSFISFVELSAIALLTAGLPTALMRYVGETTGAGRPEAARRLFAWAWSIELVAALAGIGILAGVGLAGAEPQAAWVLAGVVASTSILQATPAALLTGLQRWRQASIAGLVAGGLATVATVVVLLLGGGITGMFAVEALASTIGLLWTGALARRAIVVVAPTMGPRDAALRRAVTRFGLAASVAVVLDLIVWHRFEFFFLNHYSTEAEIAYYSIAFAVVNGLIRLPAAAASVFAPAAANLFGAGEFNRIRTGFGRAFRLILLVTLPTVALVLALGPAAIRTIWGEDYERAGDVLLILAGASVALPFSILCGALLAGLGRIRVPIVVDIIAAAVDVGLAFLLIPDHSAIGAAVANAGAQITAGGLTLVYALRVIRPVRLEPGLAARVTAAAAGAGLAAWLVQWSLSEPLGLVLGLAAGVSTLLVLCAAFRVMAADDAEWLAGAVGEYFERPAARLGRWFSTQRGQDR
jgi:O-antigen/teichoic acid export membrane protein